MKRPRPHICFLLTALSCTIQYTSSEDTNTTYNWCPESFSGFVAGPGCISYIICSNGVQSGEGMACQEGTLFNEELSLCDFEENVSCETTALPTQRPTRPPTVPPTPRIEPTTPSPTLPPNTRSPSSNVGVEDALDNAQHDINNKILLYESGFEGGWLPSTVYRYDTMLKALQLMYLEGVGDYKFYLGEDVAGVEGVKVGLVNLAAFLAQSMKETIKYNACDENNWDIIENKYPLSNACGQLEQSYQDYVCPEGMEHMQCEVDPNMELTASTTAMWYGAPGPLFCGPKTKYPFTGYWDYGFQCDFPWKDPPEYCPDYPGQKGGRYDNSEPVENRNNRTDVEGCCWWGRGVIQTTGICNFGILNYYSKRAADEGRDARYPDLDFCKDPGLICSREDHKELKWIAGFFYWMKSVQPYDDGWNYINNLKAFVSGGMEDTSFIDAVSGIVNRGCHNPPCPNGSGQLDGGYERSENFSKVLEVLFEKDGSPRVTRSTEPPSFSVTALIESDSETENESGGGGFTADVSAFETEDQSEEWVDNEEDWSATEESGGFDAGSMSMGNVDVEEDWSEVDGGGTSDSNLFCGETQRDAALNCGEEGNACQGGICPGDLKCYMVTDCGSVPDTENIVIDDTGMSAPPSPVPNAGGFLNEEKSATPTLSIMESAGPASSFTTAAPVSDNTEESTSGGGFDIKNTYFCGIDRADAATSCSKRCRSGSPSECPDGMSCFGYTPCPTDIGADETITTTDDDTTSSPISSPSSVITSSPASLSGSNIGITQNYCAKSLDDLTATCASAITCNDGEPDCPTGTYCWGDRLCGDAPIDEVSPVPTAVPSLVLLAAENTGSPSLAAVESTLSPEVKLESNSPVSTSSASFFCAKTMEELEETCSTAQGCDPGACPSGTYCFPFTCNGSPPKPTNNEPTQQLYCATTMEELAASCSTAQECNSGPCPDGTACYPFDCDASSAENQTVSLSVPTNEPIASESVAASDAEETLCPPTYTGWLSLDCFEYWECIDGLAGPISTCPDGMKFDKVITNCNTADIVNDFCYGPANGEQQSNDPASGGQQSNSLPDDASSQESGPCVKGKSGWQAAPGCREYYWCDDGRVSDSYHDCGEDLLFDSELELCNFADQVVCESNNDNSGSQVNQPNPPPAPILLTQAPISQKRPDVSSNENTATALDDKEWPESTAAPTSSKTKDSVESEEDLPPWLAHVVKESEADSSAGTISWYFSFWCLLLITAGLNW